MYWESYINSKHPDACRGLALLEQMILVAFIVKTLIAKSSALITL